MPNSLERELNAIHNTIAELKRKRENTVNIKHYEYLTKEIQDFENKRLELLEQMEVEL